MITYEQAKVQWEQIKKLQPKEKYSQLKKLCNQISLSENPSIEEIDFISSLITKSLKTLGFPGAMKKKLNQLALVKCQLLGIDIQSVNIIYKKNFKLLLETGTVGIGDSTFLEDNWLGQKKEAVTFGKRIFFATGGDGVYNLQVRVVDAPEPLLSLKEYNRVGEVAGPYIIQVPSGILTVSDFCDVNQTQKIEIEPGNYKLSIFVFILKEELSYYICLAPTQDAAVNEVDHYVVPVLQC